MTREEAVELKAAVARLMYESNKDSGDFNMLVDFIDEAYSALRPVSRETVEKVWKGEWKHYLPPLGAGDVQCRCTRCGMTPDTETPFCAWCGAPMTDEAVEMVMERLEALKDEAND